MGKRKHTVRRKQAGTQTSKKRPDLWKPVRTLLAAMRVWQWFDDHHWF
jgi:hypothetical protein